MHAARPATCLRWNLLSVVALAWLAFGCSSPQPPTASPPTSGAATAPSSATSGPATPKVNRVSLAISPPSAEANNLTEGAHLAYWQLSPMYEFLVGVEAEGREIVPQLATAWKLEPDGKSWHFTLRKDVEFQKGFGGFTARDVKYTYDMLIKADPPSVQGQQSYMSLLADVEVPGDYEVVLRAKTPDAGLLGAISQAENIFPIASKKDGEGRGKGNKLPSLVEEPFAGTGPYAYDSRQQGVNLRYRRASEKHWRQTPDFPELEFRLMKENSTKLATLLAREVQLATVPPDLAKNAEQQGFKTIEGKAPGLHIMGGFYGVWLNKRIGPQEQLNPDSNATYVFPNSPLLDVRIRKALNKAIDRDALNKAFLRGKGTPIVNEYFHPSRPGWNPEWERRFKAEYGYDPEGARKLLAEAGYGPSNPFTTTMEIQPNALFSAAPDLSEAIATQWQAVGVKVTLDTSDVAVQRAKRARLEDMENRNSVIVTSIRQLLGVGVYNDIARGTRAGVQLPELKEVYDQLLVTLDEKKSEDLWRKWGDMAFDRQVNMPLFWLPAEIIVDPNIVRDYVFPGSISGTYTHFEYIKANPK